jgi:hypothetical protein
MLTERPAKYVEDTALMIIDTGPHAFFFFF